MTVKNILSAQHVVDQVIQQHQPLPQTEETRKESLEKTSKEIVSLFSHTLSHVTDDPNKTSEEMAKEYIRKHPELKPFLVQLFPKIEIPKITQIFARCNTGWGNSLTIRGNGPKLTWPEDTSMTCTGSDRWVWETDVPFKGPFEFKILFRTSTGSIWEQIDNNRVIYCDQKIIIVPVFPSVGQDAVFSDGQGLNCVYSSQFATDKTKETLGSIDRIATCSVHLRNNPNKEDLKTKEKKKLLHNTAHEIVASLDPQISFQRVDDLPTIREMLNAYTHHYPLLAPFFHQIDCELETPPKEETTLPSNGDSNGQHSSVQEAPVSHSLQKNDSVDLMPVSFKCIPLNNSLVATNKSNILSKIGDSIVQFGKKMKSREELPPVICRHVAYSHGIYLEVVVGNMFQKGEAIDFRVIASSRDHRAEPGGQAGATLVAMGQKGRNDYFAKVEDFFNEHRMLQDRDLGYRAQGSGIKRTFPETEKNLVPLMDIGGDVLGCSGGECGGEFLWVNGPNLKNPQQVVKRKKSVVEETSQEHLEMQQIFDAYRFPMMMSLKRAHELNLKGPVIVALPLISSKIYGFDPKTSMPYVFENLKTFIPHIYDEFRKQYPEFNSEGQKEFYFKFYELPGNKNVEPLIGAFDQAFK